LKTILEPETAAEWEWVRLCQKGDREAFAALVDLHKSWIHAHLYRWVQQRELAEDMTQEVFLRAFARIKKFRGEAKFSTWLFQIALNMARDHWRSAERRKSDPRSMEEGELADTATPSAETQLGEGQSRRRVFGALQGLPEIYRETLMLRYYSELSLDEICQIQGQGLSNVKMRIARGLGHLRKKMEEQKDES
jgi:RNA polymerase sigma factor, sigma-70 family